MSESLERMWILLVTLVLIFSLAFLQGAWAHEEHEPNAQWYKSQTMNPEAQKRLGTPYKSCCDAGDVYKTRFRLVDDGTKYGVESYEYLRDGKWKLIPPDIIKVDKTPDGRPVLFINKNTGLELCFIIEGAGI